MLNYSSVILPKESSESYRFSVARQIRDSRCDELTSQPLAFFTGMSKRDEFGKFPLQLTTSQLKTNLARRGIFDGTRAGKLENLISPAFFAFQSERVSILFEESFARGAVANYRPRPEDVNRDYIESIFDLATGQRKGRSNTPDYTAGLSL